MYSVFNPVKNDALLEPMFFGNSVNVSRYDQQKFEVFEKLIEKQLSFFWRPEEVDVSNDATDYKNLPEHEKHLFISNLKYQTLLDSIQGRSMNVALLPIVSLPELETWIETWSFSECLADGTEVLTQDGWKDLSVTTVDDTCLVYELDNETVFFEKPKQVVEYDVDTDLVHYKSTNGKQFEQLVTPNHRMPVIHRDIKTDGTRTKYFKDALLQNYKPHHLAPISGKLISDNVESITPLEKLLVAVQADGHINKRYTGERCGTIPVWFNLTKSRKIDELTKIVDQCGFDMVHLADDTRDGSKRFKVSIPLDQVVSIDLKTFEWVDLLSISHDWSLSFMNELAKWDSHIPNDTSFTYSTISKVNADIVQAIAVLCGKSPRIVIRSDDRKESYSDLYSINIIDQNYKDGQSIEKEYVKYKGKVRCLETSTGAFIIRYNGVVSVTGNTIHSRSYTHIIRNIVNDPSVIFDDIVENEEIAKRACDIAKYYDDLIYSIQEYQCAKRCTLSGGRVDDVELPHELKLPSMLRALKKKLYLCMCSINALEAIRFYVSFACSFAFAERKLMEGNAKIIKLIARDEALHLTSTQQILNLWADGKDDPEMAEIAKECRDEGREIFLKAAGQEKDWAKYLFKDGSMIGLNEDILCQYIEYVTNQRMQAIGYDAPFEIKTNPIPWVNSWLVSDNVQVAPQEAEISSYLVGQVDTKISSKELSGFSL